MAAFNAFLILFAFFSVTICFVDGQLNPIPFEDVSNCNTAGPVRQYYDVSTLRCRDCSQNETYQVTSSDGESRHVLSC